MLTLGISVLHCSLDLTNKNPMMMMISDQNWVKVPSFVWEIWCRPPAVTLTFDLLI